MALLDQKLPKIDGLDVLQQQMKADDLTRPMPVVKPVDYQPPPKLFVTAKASL